MNIEKAYPALWPFYVYADEQGDGQLAMGLKCDVDGCHWKSEAMSVEPYRSGLGCSVNFRLSMLSDVADIHRRWHAEQGRFTTVLEMAMLNV